MTDERWRHLMDAFDDNGSESRLTDEEIAEGWHFCPDWDGLLIHPSDPEAEGCTC